MVFLFAGALLLALWVLTRAWHEPILDRHEFRQLQTALSAYWIREDGFRLAYPTPLFGPPWSAPMEFPFYQACVAALSGFFHLPLEQTGRAVGIAFFLATLPALYRLLGLFGVASSHRLIVVTTVVLTPVYLFYTRTFMIESTALCLAAWFLVCYLNALRRPGWRWATLAALLGSLAALVKVTTFVVFCLPAAGCAICEFWSQRRGAAVSTVRFLFRAALPAVAIVAVTEWWINYGDVIKQSNPFSAFLASGRLSWWNFGTWRERFDPAFWAAIWEHLTSGVLSVPVMMVSFFCLWLVDRRYRRTALLAAAASLSGPLLFARLYFVHDYYFYATAAFLTGAAGLVLAGVMDSPHLPRTGRIAMAAFLLGAQLLGFNHSYGDYYRRLLPRPPEFAALVQATVPPDDVVLILGWDWNALLPYYAQRRAIMVPLGHEEDTAGLDQIAARLPPRHIAAVVWKGPGSPPAPFARWCTEHLKLAGLPMADSPEGSLYLPAAAVPSAEHKLAGTSFSSVHLNFGPFPGAFAAKMHEETFRSETFTGLARPAPFKGRSLFGIGTSATAIIAHAPSELYFAAPPGTHRLQAGFAMDPQAYGREDQTDGVEVEIYAQEPDGLRRRLYDRLLRPATEPGDRGPQKVELTGLNLPDGILIFRVSPGSADNANYDWFYWTSIDVE